MGVSFGVAAATGAGGAVAARAYMGQEEVEQAHEETATQQAQANAEGAAFVPMTGDQALNQAPPQLPTAKGG